ncbi:MAG TPA: type II secretion system F family protein [Bryobacteraceae bacterium]|jgi:tight adherence protein B
MIILLSVLLSFGITTLAYRVFESRSRDSEVTRVRRRLGVETEAERLAESGVPSLIRTGERNEPRWLHLVAPYLRVNERLQLLIESAGVQSTPASILKQCALMGFVAGTVVLLAGQQWITLLALPAALIAALLPLAKLRRAARKRLTKFESQFPGALEFIARSMRAGHAFSISLEMLHHEFEQPLAGEFRRVFEEQNLGMPLDAALGRLGSRVRLVDVQFFVTAVVLQRRTGGNLTEILDTLAEVIRERYKLKGKIRAISAHGRMTARALSAIPIVVGIMMFMVNKEYTHFFFHTTTGMEMLATSVALQILAYMVINKIVTIEV